ncbi:hypothetical protein [Streptomyces sp. NPDC093111]|uniref:hypothetical protein n=1 Tax=Streptomyces sp. NPDC093111 TaxID=3154978 RepID=UPI0034458096
MNPDSYRALYGNGRPAASPCRGQTGVAILAGVVWAVVLVLLGVPAAMVVITAFVRAAKDEPVGGLLLWSTLTGIVTLGIPVALTFLPSVRRMSVPARFLLAGSVALPLACGTLVWVATWGG